jgi:hypothetical protein
MRSGILIGLMAFVIGCSTITVQYDYDKTVNFSGLKTYYWISVPVEGDISPLTVKRVRSAVDTRLQAKGYGLAADNPDVLIAMHFGKQQKVQVTDWGYTYSPHGRYRGGYWGPRRIDVYQYEEGTLILDFVDSQSKELIWRGMATGEIDRYATPEKLDKKISEAVAKILKNFPPTEKDTEGGGYNTGY